MRVLATDGVRKPHLLGSFPTFVCLASGNLPSSKNQKQLYIDMGWVFVVVLFKNKLVSFKNSRSSPEKYLE